MGLAGQPLRPSLPEAIVSLGEVIPVTPFTMPGTKESEEAVAKALEETDTFIMPGNGVFAVGTDVEQAYLRLELVEHVARVHYYAGQMGKPFVLSRKDVAALLEKRAALGLGSKGDRGKNPSIAPPPESSFDLIRDIVAEEIRKILQER